MNLSEAYKILDLQPDASEDDLKKQFRKLAAKYHPDINKNPGAEEMSKKISEAYNFIKNKPLNTKTWNSVNYKNSVPYDINDIFETFINFGQGVDFGGGFGRAGVHRQTFKRQQPIETSLHLTFEEAVLGCQKSISLEKYVKCISCYGKGFDIATDCPDCKGKGFSIKEEKFEERDIKVKNNCSVCAGSGKKKNDCQDCNHTGSKKIKTSIDVKLPGGIVTGTRLKLSNQGNYNRFAGADYYEDAHVFVTVASDPDMSLAGMDVISYVEVSLLDALKGISKTVRTVKGPIPIQVPALSKDKDRISILGAGVFGKGNHVVILDIKYPQDTEKLIEFLSEKE